MNFQASIFLALVLAAGVGAGPARRPNRECDSVKAIKILPFKDEHVDDPAFNALAQEGCAATPGLVECISDETKVEDPRQAPKFGGVRAGDVAVWMLTLITGHPFGAELPPEVRSQLTDRGVYAYFSYVKHSANRKALQSRWREWLASHPCHAQIVPDGGAEH